MMHIPNRRRLAVVLLLTLLGAPLLVNGVNDVVAEDPFPALDPARLDPAAAIEMPVVPVEPGAPDAVERSYAERPDAPAAPVLVEEQGFEDEEFPPPGWSLLDVPARGDQVDPRYVFSRELCDTRPLIGGNAAAWSVGGGTEGEQLPCWTPYPVGTPIGSWLVFNLDTRIYAAGVQVSLNFKLDAPTPEAYLVCATTGDDADPFHCYQTNSTQTPSWVAFRDPLVFARAANQEQASIFVSYTDDAPTGQHKGVLIDNVKIYGLPEAVATNTPRPTETTPPPQTPPTPAPTAAPQVEQKCAFVPHELKNWDVAENYDDPPALPETGVEIRFGQDVNSETGEIHAKGGEFQYGVMQLCTRIRWWGQEQDSRLRWQWYKDGDQVTIADLNGDMQVPEAAGFEYRCIVGPLDDQNQPLPVPYGLYEVRAYAGDDEQPAAVGTALVQDDPPLCRTPIPSGPTAGPPPTPGGPTPGPTPEGCNDLMVNGGFEEGTVAWTLYRDQQAADPALVIRKGADVGINPTEGEWIAALGGAPNREDQLSQPSSPSGLFDPDQLESSTLSFDIGVLTDETKNGTNDDWMMPFFLNQAGNAEPVPQSRVTEEGIPSFNAWYSVELDTTEQMKLREGWESSRLIFVSLNNEQLMTLFIVDDVKHQACMKQAAAWLLEGVVDRAGLSRLVPRSAFGTSDCTPVDGMRIRELPDKPLPIIAEPDGG